MAREASSPGGVGLEEGPEKEVVHKSGTEKEVPD
jgi:hypothetical protein